MFKSIQIQTITGCNLKCPMCPNSKMTQPKKLMTKKLFNKILKDLDGFDGRVSLYLMNEPFLDKRLEELVKLTRKKLPKAFINLSTNGTLIDEIDLPGIDDVNISCYTQESWEKWRFNPYNAIDMRGYSYDYNNRGGNSDINGEVGGFCDRPFVQMYINALGQAILCCSDYKFEVVMGDVNKDSLNKIWNNKKYKEYRKALKTGSRKGLKLCELCNYK